MSFAYYRWFPGDYARDTAHLTMLQHGAYRQLIDAYMATGKPLRGDMHAMHRICGALSGEERQSVEFVLVEFFRQDGPVWRHPRCDRELAYLAALSEAGRRAIAIRWARERAKNDRDTTVLRPNYDGYTNQNQNQRSTKPKVKNSYVGINPDAPPLEPKKLQGKALRDSAKQVLECLNRNAGRRYEPVDANLKPILARFAEGYTEQELRAISAVKARQWKGDEKMDAFLRPKTLFNATNAAQYRAELPANQLAEDA